MAKSTEHIGKVVDLKGELYDYTQGADLVTWCNLNGMNAYSYCQACDKEGNPHTFYEINGEFDITEFPNVMTKAEANTLIRSWFVPEYEVKHQEYFKRWLDFKLTLAHLEHIATLTDGQAILAYLSEQGCHFIKMSEFNGPQFEV